MTESQQQTELDLTELIALLNAEVRAAMDEVEKQSPANLRITSVRVALGQEGVGTTDPKEVPSKPVLRRDRYSLSKHGWLVEMVFGGGPVNLRQRGDSWLPVSKPPATSEAPIETRTDRPGWIRRLAVLILLPFKLARNFIGRVANIIRRRVS